MSDKVLKKRNLVEYKNIISEYQHFLLEERGVSEIVQKETEYLSKLLIKEISDIKVNYNNSGIFEKSNQYDYTVFDTNIILIVNFIFFIDRDSFLECGKEYINRKYYYNQKTNTLLLNVMLIDNNIVINTFKTKIAHELKHLYQIIKTNKTKLNKEIYYLILSNRYVDSHGAVLNISNLSFNIETYKHIKNIIYLTSKYEHEAYISELYTELYELGNKPYYETIKHTNTYKAYQSFVKDINFIKNISNKKEIKYILDVYNLNYNKFIINSENALDIFKRKMWKTVSLFNDEQEMYAEK